jgi:hypothetical protein
LGAAVMARYVWSAWFALCTIGAALLLWFMFRALDGSVAMLCIGCQEGLDTAQADFELRNRDSLYDFDAWRRDEVLKCQNAPSLRICRATPIVGHSEFGPHRSFMSFACSATECAWVDP